MPSRPACRRRGRQSGSIYAAPIEGDEITEERSVRVIARVSTISKLRWKSPARNWRTPRICGNNRAILLCPPHEFGEAIPGFVAQVGNIDNIDRERIVMPGLPVQAACWHPGMRKWWHFGHATL
jgi:hypothetical protein